MSELEQPLISEGFNLLAKNTEISLGEYTSITQSQADIELYLAQHFSIFSTLLYGAFTRKTIVSPLAGSIVDMLILFRDIDVKYSFPSHTFKKLRTSLISQYPDAYVLKGRNALILPMKKFLFKIQPAYAIPDYSYMLSADKFNEWIKYDVNAYNESFSKENARHRGQLIQVVRMMKTWNRVSGNLFNGYYIELLVTKLLSSYEMTSYSETLRYIFAAAVAEVVFQKNDPANLEFQVEGLNDIDNLIRAMILLKKTYHLANEAVILEKENKIENAFEIWNRIFPDVFPTSVDMAVAKVRNTGIKGADALRMMMKQNRPS